MNREEHAKKHNPPPKKEKKRKEKKRAQRGGHSIRKSCYLVGKIRSWGKYPWGMTLEAFKGEKARQNSGNKKDTNTQKA